VKRWLLLVASIVAVGGCKREAAAPPPAEEHALAPIPAVEAKRGQDACNAYVAAVCACTVPAAKEACGLARALVDAVQTGLEVAASPDTSRQDALQTQDHVRKTIKSCIEGTAKLPALGC
jgi:hypothetical protein